MLKKKLFFTLSILLLTISVFSQGPASLPLENSDYKYFYLSPTTTVSEEVATIDTVSQIRVELMATAGVIPSIITPGGQIINQSNISNFGGSFYYYQIPEEAQSSFLATELLAEGEHYLIEIPTQGPGNYTIRLEAPAGLTSDIAAAARIVTDSQIGAKLFVIEPNPIVGRPIALAAAVFDGQTPVANANVGITAIAPDGSILNFSLLDNGAEGDNLAADGIYSTLFTPNQIGEYSFLAEISGSTAGNISFSRQSAAVLKAQPFRSRLTGTVNDFSVPNPNDSRFINGFIVEAETNTSVAGAYGLVAYLKTPNGRSIIAESSREMSAGIGTIQVNFSAEKIREARENGPFIIEKIDLLYYFEDTVTTIDSLTNIGQTRPYQLSQMTRPKISLTGMNNVIPIDTNGNGKYEALTFQIGVDVTSSAYFEYSVTSFDSNRDEMAWNNGQQLFSVGENVLSFTVSGETILNHNKPGPYQIGNLMIWNENNSLLADEILITPAYDLSQFEGSLYFTGQNFAQGIDVNSNGGFEFLRVQSWVYSSLAGSHEISFSLFDSSGNLIQTLSKSQNFSVGENQIQFDFNGSAIQAAGVNGPLTIRNVTITGQGRSLSAPLLFTTQSFNSGQFETGLEFAGNYSATGIDTNADGKFNFLRVQGNVNAGLSGSYSVYVTVLTSEGNFITGGGTSFNFVSGINTFSLDIAGNPIYLSGVNGPYRISVSVNGQGRDLYDSNLFQTPAFNFTDFEMTFGFTGVNTAVGLDTNSNGKFEKLRITAQLRHPSFSNNSQIAASLFDANNNLIERVTGSMNLSAGLNNVIFEFDGIKINGNGVNGPYRIGDVSVNSFAGNIFVANLFSTQFFDINEFESGQTDLRYVNYRIVPVDGDGDAFWEAGETADVYVRLMNVGNGTARVPAATLTSGSTAVEIGNGTGGFANIAPAGELESLPFRLTLKPEMQTGTSIPVVLTAVYNQGQTSVFNFAFETGKPKKMLYVKSEQNRNQIFSAYSDGTGKVNLSNNFAINDQTPVASPDGSKILFVRLINSTTRECWIMNSDGTNQQRLTGLNRNSFLAFKWSPNGDKILFLNRVNNLYDLFVINNDGTGLTQLTNNSGQEDFISWSPDGSKIVYTKNGEIHTINPDGTQDTVIHTFDYQYDIAWSPNGAWIGWINGGTDSQNNNYYRDVFIARPDGSEKTKLTQRADARKMAWSPDSSRIAYVNVSSDSQRQRDIYLLNVDTLQTLNATNIPDTVLYNFDIDDVNGTIEWSADGSRILLAGSERLFAPVFASRRAILVFNVAYPNLFRVTEGAFGTTVFSPTWITESASTDAVAPASSLTTSPLPNSAGWHKENVGATIAATDNEGGSGVRDITYSSSGAQIIPNTVNAGSSTALQINSEGISILNYFATDNTGNAEPIKTITVKIDKTAPVTTGIYSTVNGQTVVTLTAEDALSGIQLVYYAVDEGQPQIYSGPIEVNGEGNHTVTYYSTDAAGNVEEAKTMNLIIDTVAPTTLANASPVNAAGWSRTAVSVELSSTDTPNGTGVREIIYSAVGGQIIPETITPGNTAGFPITAEGITDVSYNAVDNRGNLENVKMISVKIDRIAPLTTASHTINGQIATVSLAAVDSGSGVTETSYSINGGTPQTYSGPFAIESEGTYSINYFSKDLADNTEEVKTLAFSIDATAPISSAAVSPEPSAGWHKETATITLSAVDNTNGTGVKEITYSATGALTIPQTIITGSSGSFQIATEGITTVSYFATDQSGNVEQAKTVIIKIDRSVPISSGSFELSGQQAIVTIASADTLSGISAVAISIDGGTVQTYTEPFSVLGAGNHTVTYFATDLAGNVEPLKTLTFVIPPPSIDPIVTILSPESGSVYSVGQNVNFAGTFSDDQCGTHTAVWNFDGIPQTGAVNETTREVTAEKAFNTAGVYLVSLTVTNGCGGSGTANTVNNLTALIVIYDPSGGFVTGGGWINSPAGAYIANPALIGKASFGFNSKYLPGANTPTGNTEFHFRVADFTFRSTTYDWLVVAGSKAQYKGSGMVNGSGNYGFMLTAVDGQLNGGGGIDKFRMKIWDKSTGTVIYDNQLGSDDNQTPSTALGGGSIIIHK